MKTSLSLEYTHETELPPGHTDEIRTPDALVERFLDEYTEPGDAVLDIFAGYGTTLSVAERMDRVPYGIEYEGELVEHIRESISNADNVRHGDVLDLEPSWFPSVECCFTSPPFMEQSDTRNPFENYAGESTYEEYLDDVETAFAGLESLVASDGHVIIDVSNMKYEGRVTTLAWDVAERVSNVFHFDGEVVVHWQGEESPDDRVGQFGYGYDHSYCLVFSN